jgi:hypothetical protein
MKNKLYFIGEIAKLVASKYNPNERIDVIGPYEGSVLLPDGFTANFDSSGRSRIPRKSLGAANAIGIRKVRSAPRRRRRSQ